MRPSEAIGQAERRYLRAVHHLARGKAKTSVSFSDVQEDLTCSDEEADRCCEFWTRRGVVEWSGLGHISLTHLGLARARRIMSDGMYPRHLGLAPNQS